MSTRTLTVDLPDEMWKRLDRLAEQLPKDQNRTPIDALVVDLLDHVQQGVYRSGSWERDWLMQCVGDEAVHAAYALEEDPL